MLWCKGFGVLRTQGHDQQECQRTSVDGRVAAGDTLCTCWQIWVTCLFLQQSSRFNCSLFTASGFWGLHHGWEAGRHPGQPSYWLKTLKDCGKASGKINVWTYSMRCEPVLYSMRRITVLISVFNGTHTVNLFSRWWMVTDGIRNIKCWLFCSHSFACEVKKMKKIRKTNNC